MTNAPVCNYPGGSNEPTKGTEAGAKEVAYTTLVELDHSKIYGSKEQAAANPAACVYVERAAVKITVVDGRASEDKKIGNNTVTINGWKVINNEEQYYNTRQIEAAWGPYFNEFVETKYANAKWRFVSLYQFLPTLPASQTHTKGYRTYFAKDINYNNGATLQNTSANDTRPWIDLDKHAYTTENTFDVEHQTWINTTMVTVKATIGEGSGFYTVSKGGQTMYADATNALAAIENIVKNDPAVTTAYNNLLNEIRNNNLNKTVTAGLNVAFKSGSAPTTGTTDVKISITPAYTIKDGDAAPEPATYEEGNESALKTALETAIKAVMYSNPTETDASKLETADAVLLSYYAGGVSYYNARIKHFGDIETPWSATGDYISGGGTNVTEIYGYPVVSSGTPTSAQLTAQELATKRFLGRYGVVRDNWYKLSIDKIGKIGTAEPVDPSVTKPDTPDDEIENFISVHVHIVPWVLRTQSVQF